MSIPDKLHCIKPDCPAPYPQPGHHKFCLRCGTSLRLCDRYLPFQRLGIGGFAAIYAVWDLERGQERVLKVLTITSEKALKLFEQEAVVLASLRHPGIPKVTANSFFLVARHQQQPLYCLVMEKILGPTLEDVLIKYFPQGCPEILVLDWLCQAADILEVLHRCHIIHRDIKPSNLMLRGFRLPDPVSGETSDGQLVLIDFGGAKQKGVKDSSTRLFSSGYSPPEQMAGQFVEPSADIYALGRTMIHLLTGKHPMELEVNPRELQWQQAARVSPGLANLLEEMTRWEVEKRPQSVRDLRQRLAKIPGTPFHRTTRATRTIARTVGYSQQQITRGQAIARQTSTLALEIGRQWTKVTIAAIADIAREMWGGAIGAVCGTLLGFFLADWTPLGWGFAHLVAAYLPRLLSGVRVEVGPELLLLACVGWGTGWGLAQAGGFGQRVQRFSAASMGFLGYSMAGLLWAGMPYSAIARFFAAIAVATTILPLGLGLPSHLLFHAFAAASGTTILFALSLARGNWSDVLIEQILSLSRFDLTVGFCSLLGMGVALGLGISYYIFVPLLSWLDRR